MNGDIFLTGEHHCAWGHDVADLNLLQVEQILENGMLFLRQGPASGA